MVETRCLETINSCAAVGLLECTGRRETSESSRGLSEGLIIGSERGEYATNEGIERESR